MERRHDPRSDATKLRSLSTHCSSTRQRKASCRCELFYDGGGDKPFRINPVRLTGDLAFLTRTAGEEAFRAANNPKKIVFCPPIATFKTKDHAAEGDIHQGLALSVECDEHPRAAREKLEELRRGPSQRCCCGPSPPFPAAYIRRLR
jgi:hypothetical protein